ncbi:MAG: class IV adenylate cyclase [Clostridia bacterium]|nr:class IV adenylate cyclase [Clostridia bacterium]
MIEVEILVEIFEDIESVKVKLDKFDFKAEKNIIDTYYYDPLREDLKPDKDEKLYASFRIREKENITQITYKNDIYKDGIWQYSDELETQVNNPEIIKNIINCLGLKTLAKLSSHKMFYKYNDYEIVLEEVENLGTFLEVELQNSDKYSDYKDEKNKMQKFIDDLGLNVSSELNSGKPELYIKKYGIN